MSDPKTKQTHLTGGCLCRALRYEVNSAPTWTGYCHCTLCQRSTGAPVLAFASVPVGSFNLVNGEPARYPSSNHGERWFCATCGTQIAYCEIDDPDEVDLNVGSLDDPNSVPPQCHIFESSRIVWFNTDDDLPRFAESEPKQATE